jgi:hypothetical protein
VSPQMDAGCGFQAWMKVPPIYIWSRISADCSQKS